MPMVYTLNAMISGQDIEVIACQGTVHKFIEAQFDTILIHFIFIVIIRNNHINVF